MAGKISVKVPAHTRRGKKVKGYSYTRKAPTKRTRASRLGSKAHMDYLKTASKSGARKHRKTYGKSLRKYQRVARKRRASRRAA